MPLTEVTIARRREMETASTTGTSVPIVSVALLGGALLTPPDILLKKLLHYKRTQVSSPAIIKMFTRSMSEGSFQPKTFLGKQLLAIRNRAISKGLALLDADEIGAELSRRRGEFLSA